MGSVLLVAPRRYLLRRLVPPMSLNVLLRTLGNHHHALKSWTAGCDRRRPKDRHRHLFPSSRISRRPSSGRAGGRLVHGDSVASKNLRPDHPIPIAAQFRLLFGFEKLRRCPPSWGLCFRVFRQFQPRLLGIAEFGLSCRELRAQSIHRNMVLRLSQGRGDLVPLSLQFDHVLLRLAE
jgi:hypothetical protein